MNNILEKMSRLVTARPYITLLVILIITVLLAAGATRRAPPPETAASLRGGRAITEAMAEINELFGDSGETSVVTLLFRGEAVTPEGLSQMDALKNDIVSDAEVGTLLARSDPVIAPTSIIKAMLQVDSFESVTQAKIYSAPGPPEIKAALSVLAGNDTDGTSGLDRRCASAPRRGTRLVVGLKGAGAF